MAYRAHAWGAVLAVAVGCGGEPAKDSAVASGGDTCGQPEDTTVLVITSLNFTRETSATESEGFDLDGVVSTGSDAEGCGHADYTSSDGTPGIDNAIAALIPVLESIGAGAVESLINDAITSGELLILAELQRVDSVSDDACVDLELHRGEGVPLMGTDGELQMDQTFAVDPSRPTTFTEGGTIQDGVFAIEGVTIALPVQILDEFIELELEGSAMRLVLQEDGSVAGRLAGGMSASSLGGQIGAISDIGGLQDVVPPLLEQAADLWPDENGNCTHISVGMDVTARRAFLLPE